LVKQQSETLRGIPLFMHDLLDAGGYEFRDDRDPIVLAERACTPIPAVEVRAAIEDFLFNGHHSDKAKNDYRHIQRYAEDWFGAYSEMRTVPGHVNKKRYLVFPSLSDARARIKSKKGIDFEATALAVVAEYGEGKIVPIRYVRGS
jgi:hypothetical protein